MQIIIAIVIFGLLVGVLPKYIDYNIEKEDLTHIADTIPVRGMSETSSDAALNTLVIRARAAVIGAPVGACAPATLVTYKQLFLDRLVSPDVKSRRAALKQMMNASDDALGGFGTPVWFTGPLVSKWTGASFSEHRYRGVEDLRKHASRGILVAVDDATLWKGVAQTHLGTSLDWINIEGDGHFILVFAKEVDAKSGLTSYWVADSGFNPDPKTNREATNPDGSVQGAVYKVAEPLLDASIRKGRSLVFQPSITLQD